MLAYERTSGGFIVGSIVLTTHFMTCYNVSYLTQSFLLVRETPGSANTAPRQQSMRAMENKNKMQFSPLSV